AIGGPTDIAFASAGAPADPVRLFEHQATPVEFVPPDRLPPGILGVLIDETADTVDVSATIVDLAVRGFLRIEEVSNDKGKVDDYRLVRLTKNAELLGYEAKLLTSLFSSGPTVRLSSLKNKFAKKLSETRAEMYREVVERGWFEARPDHVRA